MWIGCCGIKFLSRCRRCCFFAFDPRIRLPARKIIRTSWLSRLSLFANVLWTFRESRFIDRACSRWHRLLGIPPNSSAPPGRPLWDWIPIIVFVCLIPSRDLFDHLGGCRCCFLRISYSKKPVMKPKRSLHGRVKLLCVFVWPSIQPHREHDPSICYSCNWTSCTAAVDNHFLPERFFVCLGQSITISWVVIGLGAILLSRKAELQLAALLRGVRRAHHDFYKVTFDSKKLKSS